MIKEIKSLLIIGNTETRLDSFKKELGELAGYSINAKTINSPHLNIDKHPQKIDVLICLIDDSNVQWLKHLSLIPSKNRPAILVIAQATTKDATHMMRLSMQAGARDFITEPVNSSEVKDSLHIIHTDLTKSSYQNCTLTTLINAKGGSGASLLACNLAHIAARTSDDNVLLIDLDMQFGTQTLQLNIKPPQTIIEALQEIDDLDPAALKGYMARHNSGLALLSATQEQIILPGEISADSLAHLLTLANKTHNRIFVDLPRQIDQLTATVLEESDQILIVVQQSLAHMRDAKRLIKIIKSDLAIVDRNITIIVNRYNEQNNFTIKDIKETLDSLPVETVPNDFKRVVAAADLGVPLFDYANKAPFNQSLITIAERLGINVAEKYKHKGFLNIFS